MKDEIEETEKKEWKKPELVILDIAQTATTCGSGFPTWDPNNPNSRPPCS